MFIYTFMEVALGEVHAMVKRYRNEKIEEKHFKNHFSNETTLKPTFLTLD